MANNEETNLPLEEFEEKAPINPVDEQTNETPLNDESMAPEATEQQPPVATTQDPGSKTKASDSSTSGVEREPERSPIVVQEAPKQSQRDPDPVATSIPEVTKPPSYDASVEQEPSPVKPTDELKQSKPEKPAPEVTAQSSRSEHTNPPTGLKRAQKKKLEPSLVETVKTKKDSPTGKVNPGYIPEEKQRQTDPKLASSRQPRSREEPPKSSGPSAIIGGVKTVFKEPEWEEPETGKTTKVDMAAAADKHEPREQYDNLFQYLLACIGFAVGLGNVWRFPKVVLENGGGAFIIPWIIVIIIQGIPLMMVELAIGQRFRGGPMHSYGRMNKFCWGVGASMGFCSLYISLFYNSILSYAFMYFFNSFTKDLPWLTCSVANLNNSECKANPAKFYFENSIVNAAPNLESGFGVVWPLYFATLIAWFVVFLAMLVGVQSVGKVIYFTALYPYLMLTILFFIGVTADGAEHGLEYLFDPDWSKLGDFRVWQAASEQVFFSASLSFGGLIAMASYMPVKNNTFRDAIVIVVVNSLTSLYAAFGIFSIKGHMAKDEYERCKAGDIPGCNRSLKIKDYVSQDDASTGLVFIAMAKALDLINDTEYGASVLSMMFYLMIITLGLDSAFGSLEGYLSILKDFGLMKKFGYKWTLFICCFLSAIVAMLFASVHGSYFIDIFDKYGCVLVLVFIGLFEFIAVGWVYGFNNFMRDFKLLTDQKLYFPFMFLIKYIGPLSIAVTLIGQFVLEAEDDEFLTYLDPKEDLPWWAKMLSMILFLSAVIWFPLGVMASCYINRLRKSFDWGRVDFDYNELKEKIVPTKNPRWEQVVFFLDEYDYPENLALLEATGKLANRFPNV